MNKILLSLIGILFLLRSGLGQVEHQSIYDKLEGANLTASSFIAMPLVDNPTIDPLRKKVLKARAQITLTVDELFLLGDNGSGGGLPLDDLSFQVTFTALLNGSVVGTLTQTHTLAVNSNEPLKRVNIDLTSAMGGQQIDLIRVDVTSTPSVSTISPEVLNYVLQKQILKLDYFCDYGIDVRLENGGNPSLANAPSVVSFGNIPLNSRIQEFQWNSSYNFPNYELQVLKLENLNPNNTVEESITANVNWDNALKIETTKWSESLRITIAEGTGFYLWRVRPIGNYFSGGIADARNWGKWSDAYTWESLESTGNPISLNLNDTEPFFFYLNDPDDDKNWMYSRVIVEENKTGEGMVYANNLLQSVQSQAYSSTTEKSLISQTVMDYLGRGSLSTLPVPVANGGLDGYEDQFFLNASGTLYTAADFDDDPNYDNPITADQTISQFSYYSSNNSQQDIPDAEGYPFTRTKFLPDGSGRVVEASGVGAVHAIGTDRTSKILYAKPSDQELIAIFGDEAPQAENILKTITIDPNGSASIAYTTIEGLTIATAMSTEVPPNLQPIDNPGNNGVLAMQVKNTTIVNTYADQKIISSEVFALPQTTDIAIDYFTDCNSGFGSGCASGDCEFTLQFIISELSTGKTIVSNVFTNLSQYPCTGAIPSNDFSWGTSDNIPGAIYNTGSTLTLPPGNWKVQKVISSGVNPAQLNDVSESQLYLGPLVDLVAIWMSSTVTANGLDDFNDMLDELITNLENAHTAASGTFDSPTYQAAFNTQYFQDLVTDYNFPDDYVFNPDYTLTYGLLIPGDPNSGVDNGQIVFSAACCENLGVPIPEKEKYKICEQIEDAAASQNGLTETDIWFSDVFSDLYQEIIVEPALTAGTDPNAIPTYDSDWANAAAGFIVNTPGDPNDPQQPFQTQMDEMVYHMLTDQYFTGNAYKNLSNEWVWDMAGSEVPVYTSTPGALIPTYATEEQYGPYYTCDPLYECWYASVRAYFELKKNNGDSYNIYDAVNGDQEEEEDATGDSAGTHADDPDSADGDPSILDQLVSMIISKKMKKFSDETNNEAGDPNEPTTDAKKMALQFNIPSTFLDCAGYTFAAIIDLPESYLPTMNEVNDPILTADLTTYSPTVPVYKIEYDDNNTPEDESDDQIIQVNPAQLVYPNIKSPIWMFKYFEYNPVLQVPVSVTPVANDFLNSNPNFDEPEYPEISSVASLELSSCYHDFTGLAVPFCNSNYCTDGGHHNWDASQRYSFYKLVENANEFVAADCNNVESDPNLVPYDCTELDAMIDEVFDEATQSCSDRADYFKTQIQQMLVANCYEVVACVDGFSPVNFVSEAQVDAMVQAAVTSCGDYVDDIKSCITYCGQGTYPNSVVNSCYVVLGGSAICPTMERVTELFDPAFHIEEKLGRVQSGTFIPYGIPSQCTSPETPPEAPLNNAEPCLELYEIQSEEITAGN